MLLEKRCGTVKYKPSTYNIVVDEFADGKKLMYNSFSGVFSVMDLYGLQFLEDVKNMFHIDDANLAGLMLKAGYIVDIDKDELTTLKIERAKKRFECHNLTLIIAPTLDCNMNCHYCYENKQNVYMDEKTQQQILLFVKAQIKLFPDATSLNVMWYGGEPLLHQEAIFSLSAGLKKICEANDGKSIAYSAVMISNGVLLDEGTAKRLALECDIHSAQLTIDGTEETHNSRRVMSDGTGSFIEIVKNCEAAAKHMYVQVRVNVDKKNQNNVEKLSDYFFKERKWNKNPLFHLAPVRDINNDCILEKSDCLDGEEFALLDMKHIRKCYEVNREAVVGMFFPKRMYVFCASERVGTFTIGPNGNIFACSAQIGRENGITGHIAKPYVVTEKYCRWLLGDIEKKCEACTYLPLCMGGCGIHRIGNNEEPQCFRTFYIYKDILKLAYEDYCRQKSWEPKT